MAMQEGRIRVFSQQTKTMVEERLAVLSNIPSGNLLKTALATYGWEHKAG